MVEGLKCIYSKVNKFVNGEDELAREMAPGKGQSVSLGFPSAWDTTGKCYPQDA